jgi:hypothetical protein
MLRDEGFNWGNIIFMKIHPTQHIKEPLNGMIGHLIMLIKFNGTDE